MLRGPGVALFLSLLLCGTALGAAPGRLPVQAFSSADGLASDSVINLLTDSRGYLWIGTNDGLSRYDGRRFVNYTKDNGLPSRIVGDLVEDARGTIWIATVGGIVRMDADAPSAAPFTAVPSAPEATGAIAIDRRGTVWASCGETLCRFERDRFVVETSFPGREVRSVTETADGNLWVGTRHGIFQRTRAGAWRHHDIHPHRITDDADPIAGPDGRLWVATPFGVLVLSPREGDTRTWVDRVVATYGPGMNVKMPAAGDAIQLVVPRDSPIVMFNRPVWTRSGVALIATGVGLLRLTNGALEMLNESSGLPRIGVTGIAEDAAGNVWLGTDGGGLVRITARGAITLTTREGLADDRITSINDTDDGICVTNVGGLSCITERGIENGPIIPTLKYPGWGWNQIVVRDAQRRWWVATGEGLVEWPPSNSAKDLAHVTPRLLTAKDGLGTSDLFRLWADSRGDLWMTNMGTALLTRRDARTGRFTAMAYGHPDAVTAYAEDRAGNIWMGMYTGGLLRYARGAFETFKDEVPPGFVRELIVDAKGRLWMASSSGGVARIDDPTAPKIRAMRYTRANGLASDVAYALAETSDHRIAIGSTRGLDLLDPETGHIAHLTTADGLPSNEIGVLRSDRHGTLWLGTLRGLARLPVLPSASPAPPPRPRITDVAVNGVPSRIPELGTLDVSGFRVPYPQRRITIAFSAPHFDVGNPLRYQYRLGSDARWTDAGARSEVAYDRLPFGANVFEVRTVGSNGRVSPPSRVAFDVATPFWLRPWFLALAVALIATAATLVHRARVAHVVALERLRMRVATDLHDDLGSSLSRISILSEVAKEKGNERLLDEIGDTARGLVDALSDSIWSVDPRRDNVQSLLSRVRHFGADLLEAKSMSLEIHVPSELGGVHLDAERRRELYLILKEALNNAAKHSGARRVVIAGEVADGRLRIAIEDDGRGFVALPHERGENGGHGVVNMTERARRLGGTVSVASQPGSGTRISVAVPV